MTIKIDFFSESKKWPRRVPKIKRITKSTVNKMKNYFNNYYSYNLNLILSDKKKVKKLNHSYRNISKDTDVLTFVTKNPNKNLGNIFYCDIFFSIDTIQKFINSNNISFYDHFNHLLIHSLLHINGYKHKNLKQYKLMKNEEIKLLKYMKIKNPYIN